MNKPIASCRRIDRLKALAYDLGFTSQDARQFGKLTKTATWEALLQLYSVDCETLDTMLSKSLDTEVSYTSYTEPRDTPVSYGNIPVSYGNIPVSYGNIPVSYGNIPVFYGNIPASYTEPRDTPLSYTESRDIPVSYSNIPASYTEARDTALDRQNSTFLDWVDVGQLIALSLLSVGVFVLAMNFWRQVNPLNLFPPVKVNIQIGAKL